MINNTNVENNHVTTGDAKTVYPITFGGATDSGGLPMFKVTLTYADDSSKELVHNVDYKLVYDEVQENNIESLNKPSLKGIKFLLDEYLVAGNKLDIVRVTPFEQQIDFQIGRIDPEQIEKAFDASVMRDQELRNQMEHISKETSEDVLELSSSIADINATLETKASKTELSDAVKTLNTDIKSNADAIKKTRDDMNAKDSQLETTLNTHTNELTTLRGNQTSLGNRVASIEGKIPDSASGTNPLITKQQLLDEEMDIRDDVNEMVGELQTQITAQAAAIATLDSEKLDKNQGDINAGKYLIVGNDGNIELTTSGGGGGGGISSVAHDETLKGAGTDASPLGVAKNLSVEELTVGTDEGTLNLSITAGVATIATNNGLDIVSQTKFDKAPTTDDNTTWADALDTSLVRKAQVASAMAGFEALPDQSGNSGKFLTTNGTTASWSDKALINNSTNLYAVAVGRDAKATSTAATAFGAFTNATRNYSIAFGFSAQATASYALQFGTGTNSDSNTFKVGNANGNFEIMSADGTIPAERMSATAGTTGQVLTKTDAGMEWQEASGGTTITLKEYDE